MNLDNLYDYQKPAAEGLLRALQTYGSALDASGCGSGKTAHAVGVIRELNCPTLVIGPKCSRPGWSRMGKIFGTVFSFSHYEQIRTGGTPYGRWDNARPARLETRLYCEACQCEVRDQPCPHQSIGIHCVRLKKVPHKRGKFWWSEQIKFLVFDEAHRASAVDSSHADMLIAARRQKIRTLMVTATAGNSPMQLRAIGYHLGLHNLHDFYYWVQRHGCHRMPFGGIHFSCSEENQKKHMEKIHHAIFPERGVRLRVEEIPGFPEIDVRAELYEIDSKPGQIDSLYEQMGDAIAEVHDNREFDNDLPVTADMRARQEVELLKVPAIVELTQDAISEGKHVALFVNFRRSCEELCRRLKTSCRIDGGQVGDRGARERQVNVNAFQADESPVIVATSAAGSESLDMHDVRGKFPRLGLVAPTHSVRQFKQVLGRLRRAGAKSRAIYRVVLAAGTCEEEIKKNLDRKLNNLDALNDADLWAENLPLSKFRVSEKLQQQIERE